MKYRSLFIFHLVYFVANGLGTFIPKYYGEIGLSDGMIGVLTSVPTLVALAVTPLMAVLTDRVPKKRYLLAAQLVMAALTCFLVSRFTNVAGLLLSVALYTIFSTSIMPVATTISLEYTRQIGRDYGPIRLMGTVGYQLGALMVGYVLSKSLKNLYPLIGVVTLLSCGITFTMPNIEGHQHRKEKVPLSKLFADRHVLWMYILILFATVSSQFYMSFYSKHLGDLGMSNTAVSWITFLSVVVELPFLMFADRIAKKTNIWNWLLIGMACNGVRWIGLAFSKTLLPIFIFQIPGVMVMACYEFFPALYLNRKVAPELSGSAQNMLTLTTFGAAKIIGSLIGGQLCEFIGIPTMMAINGVIGLTGAALFWPKTRKLIREETVLSLAD